MEYGRGSIVVEAHTNLTALLAAALGYSHQNSPVSLGSGMYRHYFEPDSDTATREGTIYDGTSPATLVRSGTLCVEKGGIIFQFVGTRVLSTSFSLGNGRPSFNFRLVCKRIGQDESPNTLSSTWSFPTGLFVAWKDSVKVWLRRRDTFTISTANDSLAVSDSGGTDTVTVSRISYSGGHLARALEIALNASTVLNGVYTVAYDERRRRFIFRCSEDCQILGAHANTKMEEVIGFPQNTSSGRLHFSEKDAKPDGYTAFDSGDYVSVSDISWQFDPGLENSPTDYDTWGMISEPWARKNRRLSVRLQLPKFQSDQFTRDAEFGTIYEMKVELPGYYDGVVPGTPHKMQFYFPALALRREDANVDGPQLIKEKLDFMAESPDFIDLTNFAPGEYFCRSMPASAMTTVSAVGSYNGKLVIGGQTNVPSYVVYIEDGDTWASVTSSLGSIPKCFRQFGDKLYIGCDDGKIYSWDGSSLTQVYDFSTQGVADLELYAEKLYAIGDSDGTVIETTDGSTWTSVWSPGATKSWRLKNYNGYLWATIATTVTQVYRYDGSSWASMLIHSSLTNYASLCVHRGLLYVSLDDHLKEWREWASVWKNYDAFDDITDAKHIESFAGNLLVWRAATGGEIYLYDLEGEFESIFYGWGKTIQEKPIVLNGRLMMPINSSAPMYYAKPKEMFLVLQNEDSSNPL